MLRNVTKLFLVCTCYLVVWTLFLWLFTSICVGVLGVLHVEQTCTDLVSGIFIGPFPHGLAGRIEQFGGFLFWTLLIIYILIIVPLSYLLVTLPFINYILVVLSIENATSFKCLINRSLIVTGYIVCLQAIIWYLIKDTVYLSSWGYFITESFVLATASVFLNALFYRRLVRYQVQLKLKPIIKYLTTVEK